MRGMIWIGILGLGVSFLGCRENNGDTTPTTPTTPPPNRTASSSPNVDTSPAGTGLVVSGDGDLGEADYGEEKTTTFTVKNASANTLQLSVRKSSCACAKFVIDKKELAAGESTDVAVTWIPKFGANANEVIEADLTGRGEGTELTVKLEARGVLKPAISIAADRSYLAGVTLASLKEGKIKRAIEVTTADPELKDFKIEASKTGPGIELAVEPFKPMAPAVAGYRVMVTFKEGIAVGDFREVVSITTDRYQFPFEVAFTGLVTVGGVTMEPYYGVKSEDPHPLGRDKTFTVVIRMTDNEERTAKLESIKPAWLIGKLEQDGKNTWRLSVTIPGSLAEIKQRLSPNDEKRAEKMFEELLQLGIEDGGVTITTTNPDAPTIRVPISDADLLPPR